MLTGDESLLAATDPDGEAGAVEIHLLLSWGGGASQ